MKKVVLSAVFAWLLCASYLAQASWYSGGTLQRASALEWQQASSANKLATVADFVTIMHRNGQFKPVISQRINGVESLRPLAQELVNQLNISFEAAPEPAENRRIYGNVNVADTAAMLMILMGWATP